MVSGGVGSRVYSSVGDVDVAEVLLIWNEELLYLAKATCTCISLVRQAASEHRSIVVCVDHVNAKAKVLDMARATRVAPPRGQARGSLQPSLLWYCKQGPLPCFHPLMPYLN